MCLCTQNERAYTHRETGPDDECTDSECIALSVAALSVLLFLLLVCLSAYPCVGALPAMVESLGDYFAAADIAGAPVPPPSVISRAVALQGATCALAGAWGTTSGTTAYNEVSQGALAGCVEELQ